MASDSAADQPTPAAAIPYEGRRPRLRGCVEAWPECREGDFNPKCCRFPKSCSCDVYDEQCVTEADLEALTAPAANSGTPAPDPHPAN